MKVLELTFNVTYFLVKNDWNSRMKLKNLQQYNCCYCYFFNVLHILILDANWLSTPAFKAPFTRIRTNICTDKNLHGSTLRLHGTAELSEFLNG